jgi:hypothetical protein
VSTLGSVVQARLDHELKAVREAMPALRLRASGAT